MRAKKPKNRSLIILGVSAGLLALLSIVQLLDRIRPTAQSVESFMRSEFLTRISKTQGDQLLLGKEWFNGAASRDLVDPKNLLPNGRRLRNSAKLLLNLESCGSEVIPDEAHGSLISQTWKVRSFYGSKCLDGELDPNLWKRPPFIHPKGGSWAAFIWKSQKLGGSWARENRRYFHIGEWKLLDERGFNVNELMIRKLDISALQAIFSQKDLFFANDHLFVQTGKGFEFVVYKVLTKDVLESVMRGSGIKALSHFDEECLFYRPGLCFKISQNWFLAQFFWFALLSICLGILVGTPVILAQANLKQRMLLSQRRDITFQTLAHELRHPATSINLSLELLRDRFDSLSEDLQKEVLRMVDEVNRLKRLVKASEQYLVSSKEGDFLAKPTKIQAVNSFLGRISRQYGVDFESLPADLSFVCDAYWLGVCVENLIKNALKHGAKPVIVKANTASTEKTLIIQVIDAGQGLQEDLSHSTFAFVKGDQSDGLGLGLTITANVAEMIHGNLAYESDPTTFTLTIQSDKEPQHEQNLAS